MSISINPLTYVIYVPKADLNLIQSFPEIRELNLNQFRLWLKDWEDGDEGIVQPKTHNHNTEVPLAGLIYARTIEILSPYTVEFEDGQYTINCTGANHNVSDVKIPNQVSLIVNNAAGLINNAAIEYSSFNGGVTVDLLNGYSGTVYPVGTPQQPSNSLEDALQIASFRGFTDFYFIGDAEIDSGFDYSNKTFRGQSTDKTLLTISTDASVVGCTFLDATVTGVLDGDATIKDSTVDNLAYVNGSVENCGLTNSIYLDGNQKAVFNNCFTIDQDFPPEIDMGGSGQSLAMPNYSGMITISNLADTDQEVGIGINHGMVVLSNTVTAGFIVVSGIGTLTDESTGTATVNIDGLMSKDTVALAVQETIGTEIEYAAFGGGVWVDAVSGTPGTAYPAGAPVQPVDNLTDAVTIAVSRGFKVINFIGDYTFPNTTYITGYSLVGEGYQKSTFTFVGGSIVALCNVFSAKCQGDLTGVIGFTDSHLDDLGSLGLAPSSQDVIAMRCLFSGTLQLPSNYSGTLHALDCWSAGSSLAEIPIIDLGDGTADIVVRNYSGGIRMAGITQPVDVSIDMASGIAVLDSSVTNGSFVVRGVGNIEDNSSGAATVDSTGLISQDTVAIAVWDEDVALHTDVGTSGEVLRNLGFQGAVWVNVAEGTPGTAYPQGTPSYPVDNIADAITIAGAVELHMIRLRGMVTLTSDLEGMSIVGMGSMSDDIVIAAGVSLDRSYFERVSMTGTMTGAANWSQCILSDLSGATGVAIECGLNGTITLGEAGTAFQGKSVVTISEVLAIDAVGTGRVVQLEGIGDYVVSNMDAASLASFTLSSGSVEFDASCVDGASNIDGNNLVVVNNGLVTVVDTSLSALHGDGNWEGAGAAADIADAVWDEPRDEHETVGSFGAVEEWSGTGSSLDPDEVASAVWNALKDDYGTPGTMGWLQGLLESGIISKPKVIPGG